MSVGFFHSTYYRRSHAVVKIAYLLVCILLYRQEVYPADSPGQAETPPAWCPNNC